MVRAFQTRSEAGATVRILLGDPDSEAVAQVELPLAVPGGHEPEQADEFIGLIPPGQTVRRPAPPAWQMSYVEPEPVPIEFLDSAGRSWLRDEQGTLARIDR